MATLVRSSIRLIKCLGVMLVSSSNDFAVAAVNVVVLRFLTSASVRASASFLLRFSTYLERRLTVTDRMCGKIAEEVVVMNLCAVASYSPIVALSDL